MKKDQVVILEKRGIVLVSGENAKDFLQNIITNDINKVSYENSIFSALLTPQGKYLNEFFIIKNNKGYLLDCSENSTSELIKDLSKYKLRSKVEIEDFSSEFVIGVINNLKFKELQEELKSNENTITYRDTPIFLDTRNEKLGARIISNLEKLYLKSLLQKEQHFQLVLSYCQESFIMKNHVIFQKLNFLILLGKH